MFILGRPFSFFADTSMTYTHKTTSKKLYLFLGLFILGWWAIAFGPTLTNAPVTPLAIKPDSSTIPSQSPYLHPLSREKIHEALLGNTELMLALMAEWDTEARLLFAYGSADAERLPSHKYLRAQLLGRSIIARDNGVSLTSFNQHPNVVVDDAGKSLNLTKPRHRFLPQTYVSASFLLALASPDQIVALPKGLRELTQLYPSSILQQIPLDCSPYLMERLFRNRPDLAFVAAYTLPSTRQALINQGIDLFTISHIDSIEEICSALTRLGTVVGKPDEAEVLALFMEAAICALDNRLIEAKIMASYAPKDVLYLNHYAKFTTPAPKTLTGTLLQKLGINCFPLLLSDSNCRWQIPLEQEKIARLQPQTIILSAANGADLRNVMLSHHAYQQIPAVQHERIYTVDPNIQDSPSQFAVLAYYDLVKSLLEAQHAL